MFLEVEKFPLTCHITSVWVDMCLVQWSKAYSRTTMQSRLPRLSVSLNCFYSYIYPVLYLYTAL